MENRSSNCIIRNDKNHLYYRSNEDESQKQNPTKVGDGFTETRGRAKSPDALVGISEEEKGRR